MIVAQIMARLGMDTSSLDQDARRADAIIDRHVSQVRSKMGNISSGLTAAGGLLTAGLTVPIIGLGAASVKAAVDFESAFASVRKTVDATEAEFATLESGIRDMAKELPASAVEIANVAAAAGQLGIKTDAILGFSRVMIDLGESTNLSAEEAATALARLANITQMPQDEFDRLGATIVDLGNNLATTEAEIVEMALRIAGAGQTIGLTEAQILGFAGALSSVGIEAQMGGSAISRVMIEIANAAASGGEDLEMFAAVAGMSAADFARSFEQDAAGAIITFIEGLGRISESGGNVFAVLDALGLTEIRVRDALLRASGAGDLFRESIDLGSRAWEENTALTTEASRRYETAAAQLEMFRNRVVEVAIIVGGALVPALMAGVDALDPLIRLIEVGARVFADLPQPIQLTVLGMLALAASIGPLLLLAGALAASMSALIGLSTALGISLTVSLGPIGLVAAAILGLITVMSLLGISVDDVIDAFVAAAKYGFTTVYSYAKSFLDQFVQVWNLFGAILRGDWAAAWQAVKNIAANALEQITILPRLFLGALFAAGKSIGASLGEGVQATFVGILNWIIDKLNWLIDQANGLAGKLPFGLGGSLQIGHIANIEVAASGASSAVTQLSEDIETSTLATEDMAASVADFGGAADTATTKVNVLEDGIISMAEALDNGFTPAQAGAIEAVDALLKEQDAAAESAYNLEKQLSKVAYAFGQSEKAAERMVLALAQEALAKLSAAQAALFGSPTQEVAALQLQLAQLNLGGLQLEGRLSPQMMSLEDQLTSLKDRTKDQVEAIEEQIAALDDDQKERRESLERRKRIIEEQGQREEKALQRQLDALQRQLDVYDSQTSSIQHQIDLYAANAAVLQAQITAADHTLLTEAELQVRALELANMMGEQSSAVRDLTGKIGVDLIPEMDEARAAHVTLAETLRVLNDEAFRSSLIPTVVGPDGVVVAFDAAGAHANLLAQALETAAGGAGEFSESLATTAANVERTLGGFGTTAMEQVKKSIETGINQGLLTTDISTHIKNNLVPDAFKASPLYNPSDNYGGYAQGTPFVPGDQLAFVHQGEAIIPAELNPWNPANRRGFDGGDGASVAVYIENVYARDEAEATTAGNDIGWAVAARAKGYVG